MATGVWGAVSEMGSRLCTPGGQVLVALGLGATLKWAWLLGVGEGVGPWERVGSVSALYSYPVKSMAPTPLQSATATPLGLETGDVTDRQWAVVQRGEVITMKEAPRLTLIKCQIEAGKVVLNAPGMPPLTLPADVDIDAVDVTMHEGLHVVDCGEGVADWLAKFLGREGCRLLFAPPPLPKRRLAHEPREWPTRPSPADVTAFAYRTSYLVTSRDSLRELNARLPSPVTAAHFRPNVEIEGAPPFDEDTWHSIRIGDDVSMHVVEPCRRCLITTTDPRTGERAANREPLKTLESCRRFPRYGKSPLFGVYASVHSAGKVKVGDPVYVRRGAHDLNTA